MKVKLLQDEVVNGGVWGKDSIIEVGEAEGRQLIAQGKAVAVESTSTSAPKPVTSTAKKEPEK